MRYCLIRTEDKGLVRAVDTPIDALPSDCQSSMQTNDSGRIYQLSKVILKRKSNWLLWKNDVLLATKFLKLYRILLGAELCPVLLTAQQTGGSVSEPSQEAITKFMASEESFTS